jgi:hypothetical protein
MSLKPPAAGVIYPFIYLMFMAFKVILNHCRCGTCYATTNIKYQGKARAQPYKGSRLKRSQPSQHALKPADNLIEGLLGADKLIEGFFRSPSI